MRPDPTVVQPNPTERPRGPPSTLRPVIPVRDDLRALEGYHSAQVDVRVRLNTNESPLPPPAAFRDAVAAELSRVEWHRYPDRAGDRAARGDRRDCTASTRRRCSPPTARTRCSRPSCSPTPGRVGRSRRSSRRTRCTPRSPGSTGATVVEGERAADFTLDPAEVERVLDRAPAARRVPDVAEQPDRARRAGRAGPRSCSTLDAGLVVVDEAYAQFADWTALDLVDEDVPLVVTRTFSKTWSMAGARLGYLIGPTWLVAELDKVVLPYHLDAVKQIAGRLRPAVRRRHGRAGRPDRRRARAARRRRCGDADRRVRRAAPTSSCSAPTRRLGGRAGLAGAGRPQRARPRLLELAAARPTASGSPSARPTRTTHSCPHSPTFVASTPTARSPT